VKNEDATPFRFAGIAGYSGDGGPATAARLKIPYGVAVDGAGNIFIAEWGNHRVRKVDADGIITTVAGSGSIGYSGDGGPATAAQLGYPSRVAVDTAGNLYIVDRSNGRIRKVDTNGIITTVAGNGPGNSGTTGEGQPAIETNLGSLYDLSVDAGGNLYINDLGNNWIRKVDTSGIVSIVAGTGARGYRGDGGLATDAWIAGAIGLGLDAGGNLYVADSANYWIRKVDTGGYITTVAGSGTSGYSGDGGHAIAGRIQNPYDVAVDAAGAIYIADFGKQGSKLE